MKALLGWLAMDNRLLVLVALASLVFSFDLKARNDIYISTNLPGTEKRIFAPGIVSRKDRHEFGSVFSPDGNEFYFAVVENGKSRILGMRYEEGQWKKPESILEDELASFNDPFLSPDGQRLYYISNLRRTKESKRSDIDIWYSKRQINGWSEPIKVGPAINSAKNEYYISFTSSGTMYFSSNYDGSEEDFDIYLSRFEDGLFQKPEKLGDAINTEAYEADVFIAPDESYIIFASTRQSGLGRGDLYISFKIDGAWSRAMNMGERINTSGHELCPYVTYDGKYFLFTSDGDIYWIETNVFGEMMATAAKPNHLLPSTKE